MSLDIHIGDALGILPWIPHQSIHCCVTSPPYFGLRDYGVDGQIGLEQTPEDYVARIVEVFRLVRSVLRNDGTLWLNLGDSYAGGGNGGGGSFATDSIRCAEPGSNKNIAFNVGKRRAVGKLKSKDLIGIPWRVAFALQSDGWYLRQDIIWHKPNPMPESVTDRCTKAHEYIFLLSKSKRYFYDAAAIKEPVSGTAHARGNGANPKCYRGGDFRNGKKAEVHPNVGQGNRNHHVRPKQNPSFSSAVKDLVEIRNKRSVWTVGTYGFKGAHFATFPPNLIRPCILAGCPVGGVVLDPFAGSGTTGQVALELGRKAVLIELNPEYGNLIRLRTSAFSLQPSALES